MNHDTALIETIALALTAACIGGFVARRVGLPAIAGYLVAGVAIGPFTPGLIADSGTATALAELGIILLMFGVGIHFSIPDLLAQRRIAVPGAIGQILVATLCGTLLGLALGWSLAGGVVLGLAISVASTVVLLRALTDRGELDTPQGHIAVAWLIVEDLFTIGVLVLLPVLAPYLTGEGGDPGAAAVGVTGAVLKAVVFAAVMLFAGARIIPGLLAWVARDRSREAFTLAVLAIAIGIAYLASTVFNVSFALGAFLAGAVLAESDFSHQAAADAVPLRDAFAVIFFVSVGMLLDPAFLIDAWPALIAVTLLVMVAKSVAAFLIVVGLGHPVGVGLTVAAALAQVGEFSFVLATLGRGLELIPHEAFQLVVAASLISITCNPLLFRAVGPLTARLERIGWLARRSSGDLEPVPSHHAIERGHAVLVGHGRVGRVITAALDRRGFGYIVISDDRREVVRLRRDGVSALYGDASRPELLEAAGIARARVAIVAIADPHAARLVVERVRDLAPRVPSIVRSHGAAESTSLRATAPGVQAVFAELELAIQMTRFALRRFGVSAPEVDAIAHGLRSRGSVPPPRPTPLVDGRLVAYVRRMQRRLADLRVSPSDRADPASSRPDSHSRRAVKGSSLPSADRHPTVSMPEIDP